jgi:hypothetical protein
MNLPFSRLHATHDVTRQTRRIRMTSISSIRANTEVQAPAPAQPKPQASSIAPASSGASRSVGSSSAANVPPAIAALSLRGADNDADGDKTGGTAKVNDHDSDD